MRMVRRGQREVGLAELILDMGRELSLLVLLGGGGEAGGWVAVEAIQSSICNGIAHTLSCLDTVS